MPREAAVETVVKKAEEFELSLVDFLDKDYEGITADRARLPHTRSLVGKNGVFLLYRLTGSDLYLCLQKSLKSIAAIGSEVLAETPGKTTFEWITMAVSWIDDLRHAVTDHSPFENSAVEKLVIPASDARKLLGEGRTLFLDIPEDVRKTLSKHKILLSTNKQTEKLTVVIGKGGAHHSLGGTVLRWCPLLLECLKSDVSKLDDWQARVVTTGKSIQNVISMNNSGPNAGPDKAYQFFRLREKLDQILVEGRDSLVVAPPPVLLKSVLDLKNALDRWANRTLLDVDSLLASCYEDGSTVVEDRFLLLNSLLSRRRQHLSKRTVSDTYDILPSSSDNFRDKTRILLERTFRKGMLMLGIDGKDPNQSDSTIEAYCAIKARELERVIHSKMQGKPARKAMSTGYRDKVRSLRYNLEDIKNPTLCARVLLGNITAESLVSMSTEQLASKDMRRSRAKAEEESRKNTVLAPGPQKSASSGQTTTPIKGEPIKVKAVATVGSILKATQRSSKSDVPAIRATTSRVTTQNKFTATAPSSGTVDGTQRKNIAPQHLQVPATPKVWSEGGSERKQKAAASLSPAFASPPSLSQLLKSVSPHPVAAPPPPSPPPSLPPPPFIPPEVGDLSFGRSGNDRAYSEPHPSTLMTNVFGGDRFTFTFSNPKVTFMAGLYLEDSKYSALNGVLPEVMSVKGRLRSEEFSRFVKKKLSGGRWTAVILRLSTFSDLDALEYKKFYKDYEGKKRIAMFGIGKEAKLFLVTPMFHGAAKHLCESFSSVNSTYAVVLTKERYG